MKHLSITLLGRVIVKKNSRLMCWNKRTGKWFNRPSRPFEKFAEDAKIQLLQYKKFKLTPPYFVRYIFHLKGKLDADLDNLEASVGDILQDAGIIEDDKFIIEKCSKKIAGEKDFVTEIEIFDEHDLTRQP